MASSAEKTEKISHSGVEKLFHALIKPVTQIRAFTGHSQLQPSWNNLAITIGENLK